MPIEPSLIPYGFPTGVPTILFLDIFYHIFSLLDKTRALEMMMMMLLSGNFETSPLSSLTMFVSGIAFILGGWLADSYLGKYTVYITSFCLIVVIYEPLIMVTMLVPSLQYEERKKQFLFTAKFLYSYLMFGMILKRPLVAEQFRLPEMLISYELYLVYDFWLQNLGIFIVFAMIPLFNTTVKCFSIYCFATPYLIGHLINIIYICVFLNLYTTFYLKKKIKQIVEKMFYCLYIGLSYRKELKGLSNEQHWLDRTYLYCNITVINNTKYFLGYLIILLVSSPYWVLRTDLYFSWWYQANIMDLHLYNFYLNPITVNALPAITNLLLLPIAYKLIYSLKSYVKNLNAPFKVFTIGYCLLGCAFLCAGIVTTFIERNQSTPLQWRIGQLKIYNALPYFVNINAPWVEEEEIIQPYDLKILDEIPTMKGKAIASITIFNTKMGYLRAGEVTIYERESVSYIITNDGLHLTEGFDNVYRAHAFRPKVILYCANNCSRGTVSFHNLENLFNFNMSTPKSNSKVTIEMFGLGRYALYINGELQGQHIFHGGEVHSLLLYKDENGKLSHRIFELVKKNEVTILCIIPQFILLSLSDLFGYIPYNVLLYTKSPPNLRGFCYSVNEMVRYFGTGFLLLGEHFSPYNISTTMFQKSMVLFCAFIVYLYFSIKLKVFVLYDD